MKLHFQPPRRGHSYPERVAILGVSLLLGVVSGTPARAQLSGYASATYGYNNNPLYNHQRLSDQVKQSYLQLGYDKEYEQSALSLGYVNSVVLFNRFEDRNYLEHSLFGRYRIAMGNNPELATVATEEPATGEQSGRQTDGPGDGANEPSTDSADSDTTATPASSDLSAEVVTPEIEPLDGVDDSTRSYLDLAAKLAGRMDKDVSREFDNFGSELSGSYRFMLSENYYLSISNVFGFRNYTNLKELSNISNQFSVQFGNRTNRFFDYGVTVGVGIRRYVNAASDTAKFEAERSYEVIIKPAGKGKPGAKVTVPRNKLLLANSDTKASYQLVLGTHATLTWSQSSLMGTVSYRINSKASTRYLAQYASSSTLTDDIYNDHFSYEGPEVGARFTQKLPWDVSATLSGAHERKKFGAPAYDLTGNVINKNRNDLRSQVELSLSRPVEIGHGVQMEISLEMGTLRNQSNDNYNDFSAFNAGLGVGIGF